MPEKLVVFGGVKFHLSGRYYRRQRWGAVGPNSLHRAVWEAANGPIPDGFHVHHIDGDTFNNDPSNLELITHSEHNRLHALERHASGSFKNTPEGAVRAKKWHESPEGKAFHVENGAKSWAGRKPSEKRCLCCGAPYLTLVPHRAKYCGIQCKVASRK